MPTALAGMTRKVFTTAALTAALAGGTVLTAGSAAAAVPPAPSCTAAVTGPIGEAVTVKGESVKDLVKRGAQEAKSVVLVHDLTIWPDHLARKISEETLTVGSVPDAQGGNVGGAVIGTAVRNALEGEAGLGALKSTQQKTLDVIENKVAGNCGLSLFASNFTPPTSDTPPPATGQPGGAPAPAPGAAGTPEAAPGVPQGTGGEAVAPRDYSGIPVASAPNADIAAPPGLRYPPSSGVPGSAEFGLLGADEGNGADTGQSNDVRNAGNADAIAAPASPSQVQLPMLLAVVALAGVTAALVRTWVLRKAS
ncbi:hypothetical protein [Prauserella cavernicola]|nr:hypothetical protein [Prauserella cavernicola]